LQGYLDAPNSIEAALAALCCPTSLTFLQAIGYFPDCLAIAPFESQTTTKARQWIDNQTDV